MNIRSSFVCMRVCIAVFGLTAISTVAMAADNIGSFGSPDQIAGEKGTFDMIGIKLGEPADNAIKALKAYNPKLQIAPQSGTFSLLPKMTITPAYVADEKLGSGRYNPNDTGNEVFLIAVTTAPGKAYVWDILRQVVYTDSTKSSLAANFVSGLEKKYGAATLKDVGNGRSPYGNLAWYIDQDGNPYPMRKRAACISDRRLSIGYDAAEAFNHLSDLIARGRFAGHGSPSAVAREEASPACGYAARLSVSYTQDSEGRLKGFSMEAENYRLGWAGADVTRQALMDAQAAKQRQDKAKAGSQSGPKI